jgi:hypothetical protein
MRGTTRVSGDSEKDTRLWICPRCSLTVWSYRRPKCGDCHVRMEQA